MNYYLKRGGLTLGLLILATMSSMAANFAGAWNTAWGGSSTIIVMVLKQEYGKVTGQYDYLGGQVTGTVQGNVLTGTYYQSGNRSGGVFQFVMTPDGQRFHGKYRVGSSGPWANDSWNGIRPR